MTRYPRKTNPGVRDGIVQKKHRTERSPHNVNYGEGYAEKYAIEYSDQIWATYLETFGW